MDAVISAGIIFITGFILAGLFLINKPEDMGQVPDGIIDPEPVNIEIPLPAAGKVSIL